MESISKALEYIVGLVWSMPMVYLLAGTGIFLSVFLGGIQFKGFIHAIKVVMGKYDDEESSEHGEISHFQALTTALSATVGLGNIAGVAVAIHVGGPGATFWMVVMGLLGMSTKFAECSLALMYRKKDSNGQFHGGPMYYIEEGLGKSFKPLAIFFSFACLFASFGAANMFQTNQVASLLKTNFNISPTLTGIVISVLTGVVILGGIKRIGQVTSKLVPFMGGLYILGAIIVIVSHASEIPSLFGLIFDGAFNGTAAAGGFAGAGVRQVLVQGVRRACFSNEAGLGSSPIAHSAATTKEPIREGVVALLEPFIDTVVICTMTALVILASGAWMQDANGVVLTANAFDASLPGFGRYFVPIAVTLFAYSTLLSWSYYGETAVHYIFKGKGIKIYKLVFCVFAFIGAIWNAGPVLNFSDIMLGLMVVPNIIAVYLLFPKLRKETKIYFEKYG